MDNERQKSGLLCLYIRCAHAKCKGMRAIPRVFSRRMAARGNAARRWHSDWTARMPGIWRKLSAEMRPFPFTTATFPNCCHCSPTNIHSCTGSCLRIVFPKIRSVVSTWCFDKKDQPTSQSTPCPPHASGCRSGYLSTASWAHVMEIQSGVRNKVEITCGKMQREGGDV